MKWMMTGVESIYKSKCSTIRDGEMGKRHSGVIYAINKEEIGRRGNAIDMLIARWGGSIADESDSGEIADGRTYPCAC